MFSISELSFASCKERVANKKLHCQHGNGSAPNITSTQVYTFVSRSKLTEVYNKTHPSALSKGGFL